MDTVPVQTGLGRGPESRKLSEWRLIIVHGSTSLVRAPVVAGLSGILHPDDRSLVEADHVVAVGSGKAAVEEDGDHQLVHTGW